jgi:hypothetical protein
MKEKREEKKVFCIVSLKSSAKNSQEIFLINMFIPG